MSSLEGRPSFELTEENGELFVHATWVTYTPGALVGMDWRASAEPQRHALDACLIAVMQHKKAHPGDSLEFLRQEIEVAVRRLEAGEQCVYLCDGVHQVSRANFYIDLTLDELVRVRNPLRLFWPEWRVDLGPDDLDDLGGPPEAELAGREGWLAPVGDFATTRGEGAWFAAGDRGYS
jgi:hypothetical protein